MASQLDFAGGTFVDGLVADADDSLRVVDAAVESHRRIVIAFVGLAFEARIAAAPGVKVVCRTAGSELEEVTDSAVRQAYRAMISFGVAGGLASHLRAGDWVVASSIQELENVSATDAVWSRKLLGMIPGSIHAPIVGVDEPVAEPAKKRELHRTTGAAAVDMEFRIWRHVLPPSTIFPSPRCEWWSIPRTAGCRPPLSSACVRMAAPCFRCIARPCCTAVADFAAGAGCGRCLRRSRRDGAGAACARPAFRAGRSRLASGGVGRTALLLPCGSRLPGKRGIGRATARLRAALFTYPRRTGLSLRDEFRIHIGLQAFEAAFAAVA